MKHDLYTNKLMLLARLLYTKNVDSRICTGVIRKDKWPPNSLDFLLAERCNCIASFAIPIICRLSVVCDYDASVL